MYILNENKDRFIDKNPNLTDEQKQQVKDLLKKYPYLESKAGDWQKSGSWTWDDFQKLFDLVTQSKTHIKKRAGIEGLTEGKDYSTIYDDGTVVAYRIYNHLASRVIASNRVKPEVWTPIPDWYSNSDDPKQDYTPQDPNKTNKYDLWSGAKWCISMNHTPRYWVNYTGGSYSKTFVFVLSEDESKVPSKKLAFTISGVENARDDQDIDLEVYDAPDDSRSYIAREAKRPPENSKYPELSKVYRAFIRTAFVTGEDYFKQLVDEKKLIPSYREGYYDVPEPGSITMTRLYKADDTLPCKFGTWNGNYNVGIHGTGACPRIIKGSFIIRSTRTLEGCPDKVMGDFDVEDGDLKNLEGMTPDVRGNINFDTVNISSLKGIPKVIRRDLILSHCHLTSLEGIGTVGGRLDVDYNLLEDLKGPTKVGSLSARSNKLKTLEGMPEVDGLCDVSSNPELTSLDGLNLTKRGFILHKKTGI